MGRKPKKIPEHNYPAEDGSQTTRHYFVNSWGEGWVRSYDQRADLFRQQQEAIRQQQMAQAQLLEVQYLANRRTYPYAIHLDETHDYAQQIRYRSPAVASPVDVAWAHAVGVQTRHYLQQTNQAPTRVYQHEYDSMRALWDEEFAPPTP